MKQLNKYDLDIGIKTSEVAQELSARWLSLCEVYLPFKSENSFWRFNRKTKFGEPSQGWKLHIPATVLEACDLFERVAPFLVFQDVRFKAPGSLKELININSGLLYGYWQVGKFLTVYPSTETEAVKLAHELHELTREFSSVAVPFDNRFLPESSIFYRYGAFEKIEMRTKDGLTLPAVRNLSGELVYDDYFQPVPEWMIDPFQNATKLEDDSQSTITPLMTTYKVFCAITQRGKGGIYRALDLSTNPPRFCVVKQGRRHGEVFWNGQDGHHLVKNEHRVLEALGRIYKGAPQVFSAFEAENNFYLAMEYIEGKSLSDTMKFRRRRFSVKQVLVYGMEIAGIIEEIHKAGWVWNDCKPANLVITPDKSLRPIDFENAYQMDESAPFDWKTQNFSKPGKNQSSGEAGDLYALGAVIYFLLTGKFYNPNAPIPIEKLRLNVPKQLKEITADLLNVHASSCKSAASGFRQQLEEVSNLL